MCALAIYLFQNGGYHKYRFRKHWWGICGYKTREPPAEVQAAQPNGAQPPALAIVPQGAPEQPPEENGPGFFPGAAKEISSLRTIGFHGNIVSLLDAFVLGSSHRDLSVVMVYDEWGYTLKQLLALPEARVWLDDASSTGASRSAVRRTIFQQILTGLAHVHSRGIIHRNLSSTSIKVAEDGRVRIGNFSYAIPAAVTVNAAPYPDEDWPKTREETYEYLAPEILFGRWVLSFVILDLRISPQI